MATVIPPTWRTAWVERWASGPGFISLLFGVLLPLGTLGFELATHACASMLFDPIPTPLHGELGYVGAHSHDVAAKAASLIYCLAIGRG